MSVEHYENFPVASWLCPPALRPAVEALYEFARTADDLADEGAATPEERLQSLRAYRQDLRLAVAGVESSARWPRVFPRLASAIARHRLPPGALHALLDAFEQDIVKTRYADRTELLDYCSRSANPVGRLLLHLYGIDDDDARHLSDSICSALQLANFWQDLSVDTGRGRLYVPESDCRRHGVDAEALLCGSDSAAVRALVSDLVTWARGLMQAGALLVHRIPGRAGWELRLVVQGGLRILERIDRLDGASLIERPRLGWTDALPIAWRALRMSPRAASALAGQGEPT